MKADHDYHLHTFLSKCSNDPAQNIPFLISYARKNALKHICITDHFWDAEVPTPSQWYTGQDLPHISKSLPFPETPGLTLSFGCEADMDMHMRLGVSPAHFDRFEFINVALTHMHMPGFTIPVNLTGAEERAAYILRRIDALLAMDLPFHKIGIAHLSTPHLGSSVPEGYLGVLACISEDEWRKRMLKAAQLSCGIELNIRAFGPEEPAQRPYRVAKQCGCKFYLASDAHFPYALDNAIEQFNHMIDTLQLAKDDPFDFRIADR